MVVVQTALDDDGSSPFHDFMNHANTVLEEMVDAGAIKAEERARMVLGSRMRRRRHLLAPFEQEGEFQQLIVEDCELSTISDFAWADYERDQNKQTWAGRHARGSSAPLLLPH